MEPVKAYRGHTIKKKKVIVSKLHINDIVIK